ncbi:ganglioside-induced differentiation-associated protein 1-like [Ptychodera flava]|uniref:ganglioside-induced differentiation-associated protein 1-like n=1 Tax=Ptychodera flava TaxID=63121 RepID=UPI00396A29CE
MAELVLYYDDVSVQARIVRIVLAEKCLSFRPVLLDVRRSEDLSPWFVRLNPEGNLPVLVHGKTVVRDGQEILKYLDETFPNSAQLFPDDSTPYIKKRCDYFRSLHGKFDAGLVYYGVSMYPDDVGCTLEDVEGTRKECQSLRKILREDRPKKCQELSESHLDLKDIYLKIKEEGADKAKTPDVEDLKRLLVLFDDVMTKVESELDRNEAQGEAGKATWLCGERYTIADVLWTALLAQLEESGLADRYWANGKRPHVSAYYDRVRSRASYSQAVSGPPKTDANENMVLWYWLSAFAVTIVAIFVVLVY